MRTREEVLLQTSRRFERLALRELILAPGYAADRHFERGLRLGNGDAYKLAALVLREEAMEDRW